MLFALITIFPIFSKFTVTFSLTIDCTCPIPQSFFKGFTTCRLVQNLKSFILTYIRNKYKYHKYENAIKFTRFRKKTKDTK